MSEAVEEIQAFFHVLYPAFHVFSSRRSVFFTFLPGKTIMDGNYIDQEVGQELARNSFSLLVNRKAQPFPPFSMFWRWRCHEDIKELENETSVGKPM